MCCCPPPLSPLPAQIDRFLYSTDNQVVAGALLAVGIVNSGVQDEVDPALALLSGE
jgi:26S proteasome regulatory subunit N1